MNTSITPTKIIHIQAPPKQGFRNQPKPTKPVTNFNFQNHIHESSPQKDNTINTYKQVNLISNLRS